MQTKYIIGFVVAIFLLVGGIAILSNIPSSSVTPAFDMAALAQCLTDKGVKFYGAFWCPHCQVSKKIFGSAQDKLPYIECSTPDTRGQLPVCQSANIETYPTWVFADGSRLVGELSPTTGTSTGTINLTDLSVKSGCPLIPLATSTPQ